MRDPIRLEPGGGRTYWVLGDRYTFKATRYETQDAHALVEMAVQPGSGFPPHTHHVEDKMFYVLEGNLTLQIGDRRDVLGPESFAAVPKGTVHRFANETEQLVRALVQVVPGGFDKFLMRIGTEISEACPTAPPPTRESMEEALSTAWEYFMEVVK